MGHLYRMRTRTHACTRTHPGARGWLQNRRKRNKKPEVKGKMSGRASVKVASEQHRDITLMNSEQLQLPEEVLHKIKPVKYSTA